MPSNELLEDAAGALLPLAEGPPDFAIVLGSGLGALADELGEARSVDYARVPGMPSPGVAGHSGRFVLGRLEGKRVVAMQGRVHLYEGHSPQTVVLGVRLMLKLGAPRVLLTNAAGGISPQLCPGDLMLIEDQINLTGRNCLEGPNDEALGPRFPDMTEVYDASLRALARHCAQRAGRPLKSGVYAGLLGPNYETPAEIRMLATLGADAVGMSTVLEAIATRHMGAKCLGISCITNMAAGISNNRLDHREVEATAQQAHARFSQLLRAIIREA